MLYLNGQPLPTTVFPDNTSQVWKLPESTFTSASWKHKPKILWNYSNESEVMQLFQLLHLFDVKLIVVDLEMTYLPYARQDKPVSNETTFALQTFWKLFNTFNCVNELVVHDPHNFNEVMPRCKVRCVYPTEQVLKIVDETNAAALCYPDKGALQKYGNIYPHEYMYGEKVRDQTTGNITSYKLVNGNPAGKNILIVDDICDGGMTFKLLAKDLLAAGAKEVNLFVTHGIFSKGVKTLFESGINRVFTKDGEVSERHNSFQV